MAATDLVQILVGGDVIEHGIGQIPVRVSQLTASLTLETKRLVPSSPSFVFPMLRHGDWWHQMLSIASL